MRKCKRLAKIILEYKKEHMIAFLFLILQSVGSILLPQLLVKIVDEGIANNEYLILIKMCSIYIFIAVLGNIFKGISNYLYTVIGGRIVIDIRKRLISKIMHMPGSYYSNMKSGEVFSTISEDVGTIEQLCTDTLFSTLADIIISIPLVMYLIYLDFRMFLITILLQPIYILLQGKVSNSIAKHSGEMRNSFGKYSSVLQEFLYNPMDAVKSKSVTYLFERIIENVKDNVNAYIKLNYSLSRGQIYGSLIGTINSIVIILLGGWLIIDGKLTMGILLVFLQYSSKTLIPILGIGQLNMQYKNAQPALKHIFKILDSDDDKNYYKGNKENGIKKGEVIFKDLKFSYNEEEFVLRNINLNFKPGEMTALIGSSGSGKTSIINLLYRLWQPDSGMILVDGTNIDEYDIEYLRDNISVVSQEIVLLNDTVYNNIVLGDENISIQEVIDATKIANIYDTIINLEAGFDTVIGDRGIKMSGGQKQRLSIARAIIKRRPIVIFDEATSALDNINETIIQQKILEVFKNHTIIVIAHRLSTIENANKIYVLNHGEIVEEGSHFELIEGKGVYYNLYNKSKTDHSGND